MKGAINVQAVQATNQGGFTPFPLNAPQTTINAQGKLEFLFTVPDPATFFSVQAS